MLCVNSDAPDLGVLLEVVPRELAWVLGSQLVVERLEVVIVDQDEPRLGCERPKGLEDQFVSDSGDLGAYISYAVVNSHGEVLSLGGVSVGGERLLDSCDVVHGAVKVLGLAGMVVAQRHPETKRSGHNAVVWYRKGFGSWSLTMTEQGAHGIFAVSE